MKNFTENELRCKCCGMLPIVKIQGIMTVLQMVRFRLNRPIIVTSGYRCPRHNKRVGGHPNSYHMQAMAADISIAGWSADEFEAFSNALPDRVYHKRYVSKSFVHIDLREYY